MVAFYDAVRNALKNQWCSYSYQDFVIAGLVAGSPLVLKQPAGSLVVAAKVTKGLQKLRDASDGWCNKGSSGGGGAGGTWDTPPPKFNGGQCEGIRYNVSFRVNYIQTSTGQAKVLNRFLSNRRGKIVGVEQRRVGHRDEIGLVEAGGSGFRSVSAALPGLTLFKGYQMLSITRSDGLPDDCGNPPADVAPTEKIDDEIDIDYEDDTGSPVSLPNNPVEWFPPCYSPTGVKLPFKVQTPLGDVCGKVNFGLDSIGLGSNITPEVELNQCRDNSLAPPPPEKPSEKFELSSFMGSGSQSPDSELVGNAIGSFDPEADKPILGVLIVAARENQDRLDQTKVVSNLEDTFPPLLYPDIGSVRFLQIIETDSGVDFSYSPAIRIQQVQSYISCPSPFGAAAVEILWRRGWNGSYQEARRKSCCAECASQDPVLPDELDRCA